MPETLSLASTVWLIYVADRSLDASQLDLSRPHTLRHRFYHHHAAAFRWAWATVLVTTTAVVVTRLPTDLIRAGILLSTAVLVYGAGVHFIPQASGSDARRKRRVSKEIQVGALFAMGVTLVCWSEIRLISSTGLLTIVTLFLAVAFSFNCRLVSHWEADLDRSQSFNRGGLGSSVPISYWEATLGLVGIPVVGVTFGIPGQLWICSLVSASGLFCLSRFSATSCPEKWSAGLTEFDRRGPLVDAALWLPPSLSILATVVLP